MNKIFGGIMTMLVSIPIMIVSTLGSALAFGLLVWWLWNATIAIAIVGIGTIGYWQAVGLCLLCWILFKGRSKS